MANRIRSATMVVGGALALLFLVVARGAQAFFGDKRHSLDGGVEVSLPRSFSRLDRVYNQPRIDNVKGRTPVITGGRNLGYRFVAGQYREWLILGGSYGVTPVILDVTVFPAGDTEALLSNRTCFSSEAWGLGNCGGNAEFPATQGLADLGDVVYQKDTVTVYRNRSEPLSPHDPEHRPALGFAAVDTAKRIRIDLYVSFGRYSAEESVKLLVDVVAGTRVDTARFAGHLAQLNVEARQRADRLTAQFSAIADSLAPIGLRLESVPQYNISDNGVIAVHFNDEHIEELTVAAALGRIPAPAGGTSSPDLKKLRAIIDPQDYGLPIAAERDESSLETDRWFTVAYWHKERAEWRTIQIKPERPAPERKIDPRYAGAFPRDGKPATVGGQRDASRVIPALDEMSKNWADRGTLHVFEVLSFREYHFRFNDNPAATRRLLTQFADTVRRMRQDMAAGKLLVLER